MLLFANLSKKSEVSPVSSEVIDSGDVISDYVRGICQWLIFAVACEIVDIFGTATNIINIICFVKQGFKDSVNVSLMGLAISDLGCLVTLIFTSICYIPSFHEADLPFDPVEVQYLTTGWLHIIFARVTSWITAFITFERCLCITLPLKVRTIITPYRVMIIIISFFALLICSVSPMCYCNRLGWKFSLTRNRTILGLVFTPDRDRIEKYSFAINNIGVPVVAFIIVVTCTIVLIVKLRHKGQWRQTSLTANQNLMMSTRDQRVTRLVVAISTMFIVCFSPLCAIFMATLFVPGFSVDGKYKNSIIVVAGLGVLFQSTNSAANIFIYYHISSKYRTIFRKLFGLDKINSPN